MNRQEREIVQALWAVERHPKGAIACLQLMDVLERNYKRWEREEKEAGWEILGLFSNSEAGLEYIRNMKNEVKERHTCENDCPPPAAA